MLVAGRLLETVIRDAPLGVRLRDPLDGRLVADDLVVAAEPVAPASAAAPPGPAGRGAGRRLTAAANGAGVWVFPEPAATRWPRWRVEVEDRRGRFLPCTFTARCGADGLLAPELPPGAWALPGATPLFSSPARVPERPVAAIRAELWDPDRGGPASWALVEATVGDGSTVWGLTSGAGQLAIFLRHPELRDAVGAGSGSDLRRARLDQVRWTVQLRARYRPAPPAPPPPPPPDLAEALGQPPAALWESHAARRPLGIQTLTYGTELVVRSADTAAPPRAVRVTTS